MFQKRSLAGLSMLACIFLSSQAVHSQQGSFPRVKKAGAVPDANQPAAKSAQSGAETAAKQDASAPSFVPTTLVQTKGDQSLYLYQNVKHAPSIAGPFPKGSVLILLDEKESYGFRLVTVPGGFKGFVYSKYIEETGDGFGKVVNGDNIGFRFRPKPRRAAEPPLAKLRRDSKLRLLRQEGDWWVCLAPSNVGGWVPKDAIEEVATLQAANAEKADLLSRIEDAGVKQRVEAQIAAQQAEWTTAQKALAEARQRQNDLDSIAQEVEKVAAALNEEVAAKGTLSADIRSKKDALLVLQSRVIALEAEDSAVGRRIDEILATMATQIMLQVAKSTIKEPVPSRKEPAVTEVSVNLKRRFNYTGWLRFEPGSKAHSPFRIVMGGETICYVTVPSARYELREFRGCEVGLRGEDVQKAGVPHPIIEVKRLVVLTGR